MTVLRWSVGPSQRQSVDQSTESTQGLHREPRGLDQGQVGRARLRHPGRKQRTGAVGLLDDEVVAVELATAEDHPDAVTCARMVGVVDQDLETLFLGIMT
jgi:hypothetical protein